MMPLPDQEGKAAKSRSATKDLSDARPPFSLSLFSSTTASRKSLQFSVLHFALR